MAGGVGAGSDPEVYSGVVEVDWWWPWLWLPPARHGERISSSVVSVDRSIDRQTMDGAGVGLGCVCCCARSSCMHCVRCLYVLCAFEVRLNNGVVKGGREFRGLGVSTDLIVAGVGSLPLDLWRSGTEWYVCTLQRCL